MNLNDILLNVLAKAVPYNSFIYLFPPRPENKITRDQLSRYEGTHLGQPKLNGDCCEIYYNSKTKEIKNFGRHRNENLKNFSFTKEDVMPLFKFAGAEDEGDWNLIVGEFMNTSKKYKDGKPWNNKFVIFDILVYKGKYLLGSTFEDRVHLLDELFGQEEYDEFLYKVTDKIFRVKSFYSDFEKLWDLIVKIDMLEGFVLKRKDAKLERGGTELNNIGSQLKCRKPTKNYSH